MSRRQRANTSAANNLSLSEVMYFVEKRDRSSGPVAAREQMLPYDGFVPASTCMSKKTQRISHLQFSCLKKNVFCGRLGEPATPKTRHHLNDFHVGLDTRFDRQMPKEEAKNAPDPSRSCCVHVSPLIFAICRQQSSSSHDDERPP